MKFREIWEVREDQEYGGEGLARSNWPANFNPVRDGRGLFHDMIEHSVDSGNGSFADELMALGALTFFRGSWNLHNPYSQSDYVDAIADEIVTQIRMYGVDHVPYHPRAVYGPMAEHLPSYAEFRRMVKRKCEQEDCDFPEWSNQDIRNIYRWMAKGYHKARAKSTDKNEGCLHYMIETFRVAFPKHMDIGMQYEIIVDTDMNRVCIDEYYEPEDRY